MKCAVESCLQNACFRIFEPAVDGPLMNRVLCDRHARALIDTYTRECAKTPQPRDVARAEQYRVAYVVTNAESNAALVYLRSADAAWFFMQIGKLEASALLALLMREERKSRPLTHEAMASAIDHLGGALRDVIIDDFIDGAYHAKLDVIRDGRFIPIDVRPSDAIALALVRDVPIYIAAAALDKSISGAANTTALS